MEYRTISEVVNPLYIRAATHVTKNRQDAGSGRAEKMEKKQIERGTGICFWSQVLSLLSSTMAFLTIVTFICMLLFLRTESVSSEDYLGLTETSSVVVNHLESWQTEEGDVVERFLISSSQGLEVTVMAWGATLTGLTLEDGTDVVLGFDTMSGYESKQNPYFGATVGRVANRVAEASFELGGVNYTLAANNGAHSLHGGTKGWDRRVWNSEVVDGGVVFSRLSPDGEEGYPGSVVASVAYTLEGSSLQIRMKGTASESTPVNMAHHSYFNLAGHNAGSAALYNHSIKTWATWYTPVDAELIPSGEVLPVRGTVFDFRQPTLLGKVIMDVPGTANTSNPGFDHNLVVSTSKSPLVRPVAEVEYNGRSMLVSSNQPGIQFYTGNFLPREGLAGKAGATYSQHGALCLETQNFPDFLHQPSFPRGILRPGEVYDHIMKIQFSKK